MWVGMCLPPMARASAGERLRFCAAVVLRCWGKGAMSFQQCLSFSPLQPQRCLTRLLAFPQLARTQRPPESCRRRQTDRRAALKEYRERERYKEAVARAVWWALDVTAWWLNNECGVSGFTWSQGHGPWLERRRGQERQNREGKGEKEELDESHGRRGEQKDAKQPKSVFFLYFCLETVSKWCLLIVEWNLEFNHIIFFIWRCIACQILVLYSIKTGSLSRKYLRWYFF